MKQADLSIRLGTKSQAYQQSFGEVTLADTFKKGEAVAGGLFCPKIFGVLEEYSCACKKYHGEKSESGVCERCGVALLSRPELGARFGHITLAAPVVHPWFYKTVAALLGITERELSEVIEERASWITSSVDGKRTHLIGKLVDEARLYEYQEAFGAESFEHQTGVEAIQQKLSTIDIEALFLQQKQKLSEVGAQTKSRLTRELQEIEALYQSKQDLRALLIEVLPVMPALYRQEEDLPPEEVTDEETGEVTVLQELSVTWLYKKVILRNKRLQRLIELNAPAIILRQEKIYLNQTIKDLFAGIKRKFSHNPQERFVDFSGHAVFAVDPSLPLSQCAVPAEMALTLWGPFLMQRLREEELASSLNEARELIKRDPIALEILQEEMNKRPTLLSGVSASPLSMLSLSPVLTHNGTILIHPLVAKYYSLRPEGEHVALHVLLSPPAREEAQRRLGVSSRLLSPVSFGWGWTLPDEALVGLLYLTRGASIEAKPHVRSASDLLYAYEIGDVTLQEEVKIRHKRQSYQTTVGRLLLAEIAPAAIDFAKLNRPQTKETLHEILEWCAAHLPPKETEDFLARLTTLGTKFATKLGASLCIEDFLSPPSKAGKLQEAFQFCGDTEEQYSEGLITEGERYHKHLETWDRVHKELHKETLAMLSREKNNLWMITEATQQEPPQKLSSALGTLVELGGRLVETPGLESLREGISTIPYFFDAWRARSETLRRQGRDEKKTELQQKIARIARELRIDPVDCQTTVGFTIVRSWPGEPLAPRLLGRTLARDTGSFHANQRITKEMAAQIDAQHPKSVVIRSPLTCKSSRGVCFVCYGAQTPTQDAVGFFAACAAPLTNSLTIQESSSTMRAQESCLRAWRKGTLRLSDATIVTNSAGERKLLSRQAILKIGVGEELAWGGTLSYGCTLLAEDGAEVETDQVIAEWDPFQTGIYSDQDGVVIYQNINSALHYEIDAVTGLSQRVIRESYDPSEPFIEIMDPITKNRSKRALSVGALLCVDDGASIKAGDLIAALPKEKGALSLRGSEELFELTPPSKISPIAGIDGEISFGRSFYDHGNTFRTIIITNTDNGASETYLIPREQHLLTHEGEFVAAGSKLCEGEIELQELLRVMGPQEVARFFLQNLSSQWGGPWQHIELILRQMLSFVKIIGAGDSAFEEGEIVDYLQWEEGYEQLVKAGESPPSAEQILLGISALGAHQRLSLESLYEANVDTMAKLATSGRHIPY